MTTKDKVHLWIDEKGVVYIYMGSEGYEEWAKQELAGIYVPYAKWNEHLYPPYQLQTGEKIDEKAPYVCKCLNRQFEVFESDSYETSIRCPKCGHETIVHSG